MALNYRNLFSATASCLNALDVYQSDTESNDPAYSEFEIIDAILAAELKIIETICKSPGHRRKIKYLTESPVYTASPQAIPESIGDVIEVRIRPESSGSYYLGEPCSSQVVSRFAGSFNPLALTLYKGLYSLEDNVLWFTGSAAKVIYTSYAKPNSPTTAEELEDLLLEDASVPEEYWGGCVALAVAKVLPKEGALTQAAGYYMQLGMAELQGISQNSAAITTFQQYQEAVK